MKAAGGVPVDSASSYRSNNVTLRGWLALTRQLLKESGDVLIQKQDDEIQHQLLLSSAAQEGEARRRNGEEKDNTTREIMEHAILKSVKT